MSESSVGACQSGGLRLCDHLAMEGVHLHAKFADDDRKQRVWDDVDSRRLSRLSSSFAVGKDAQRSGVRRQPLRLASTNDENGFDPPQKTHDDCSLDFDTLRRPISGDLFEDVPSPKRDANIIQSDGSMPRIGRLAKGRLP